MCDDWAQSDNPDEAWDKYLDRNDLRRCEVCGEVCARGDMDGDVCIACASEDDDDLDL